MRHRNTKCVDSITVTTACNDVEGTAQIISLYPNTVTSEVQGSPSLTVMFLYCGGETKVRAGNPRGRPGHYIPFYLPTTGLGPGPYR